MSTAARLPLVRAEYRPLRTALVGAGVMGQRHARVLASRPEHFALVGIVDRDPATARAVASRHGGHPATREVDAIAGAEAVVVATPTGAHPFTVRCALACGRHVLVEKPVAPRAREAAELVALADAMGVRLYVGHSERFNPVVRALARLVDPAAVRVIELRRVGARPGARMSPEGALVNLGVHDFDLAAYLTRSTVSTGLAFGDLGPRGVEESARVFGQTESGARVSVLVDQRPGLSARQRAIALLTATHAWHGDLLSPSLLRVCRTTGARDVISLGSEEPLLAQAMAFSVAVRGGASPEIATGLDGMRALRVAESAGRALRHTAEPGENLALRTRF